MSIVGPNIRSEVTLKADGTWNTIVKSEIQPLMAGAMSAMGAKFSDTVHTKGLATTLVDLSLFYTGAIFADYSQNKRIRLMPWTPYVPN